MAGWMHQHRMARWLAWILVVLSLDTSCAAQAEGIVTPSATAKGYEEWNPAYYPSTTWYRSLQEECEAEVLHFVAINPIAFGGAYCMGVEEWNTRNIMFPNFYGPGWGQPNSYGTYVRSVCPTDYNNPSTTWDQSTVPWTPTVTCFISSCPANSTGTPPSCTCDAKYQPDSTKTSCVPAATCPVLPLTQPPFSDACSTSLEQGKGVDVNNKCGKLRDDMDKAASCIADKINMLSSPPIKPKYTTPSATVRTAAYQDHLLEIWTKSQQLDTIMNSVVYLPEIKQACAATYAAVSKEKAEHGIKHQPSSAADAAPHVERRAIDIPSSIVDSLMDQVTIEVTTYKKVNGKNIPITTITSDVEDYMNSKTINPSPACKSSPNIHWGGEFDTPDWVHFYID